MPHKVALGFQTNPDGSRKLNLPRIQIRVDGETLDVLFDTGADTKLNGAAMACVADGRSAKHAATLIAQSVFERWHTKHPEWRVCDSAEKSTGATMIEVKQMQVSRGEGPLGLFPCFGRAKQIRGRQRLVAKHPTRICRRRRQSFSGDYGASSSHPRRACATNAHICHLNSTSFRDMPIAVSMLQKAHKEGLNVTVEAYPYGAASTAVGAP